MFSKKQRRGCQPPKTFRAGGKIIRDIVIQLKQQKYVFIYNFYKQKNFRLLIASSQIQNQCLFIARRNSLVIGNPDLSPITESISQ